MDNKNKGHVKLQGYKIFKRNKRRFKDNRWVYTKQQVCPKSMIFGLIPKHKSIPHFMYILVNKESIVYGYNFDIIEYAIRYRCV